MIYFKHDPKQTAVETSLFENLDPTFVVMLMRIEATHPFQDLRFVRTFDWRPVKWALPDAHDRACIRNTVAASGILYRSDVRLDVVVVIHG